VTCSCAWSGICVCAWGESGSMCEGGSLCTWGPAHNSTSKAIKAAALCFGTDGVVLCSLTADCPPWWCCRNTVAWLAAVDESRSDDGGNQSCVCVCHPHDLLYVHVCFLLAGPGDLSLQQLPCPLAPELSSGSLNRGWASNTTSSSNTYLQVRTHCGRLDGWRGGDCSCLTRWQHGYVRFVRPQNQGLLPQCNVAGSCPLCCCINALTCTRVVLMPAVHATAGRVSSSRQRSSLARAAAAPAAGHVLSWQQPPRCRVPLLPRRIHLRDRVLWPKPQAGFSRPRVQGWIPKP
jgi:hypothetical protein